MYFLPLTKCAGSASRRHATLDDPLRSAPDDIADRGNGVYRVAGCRSGQSPVRDIQAGKTSVDVLHWKDYECEKAALDDRGNLLAMAADSKIQIFRLPSGILLAERPYEGSLDNIFFSRTGRWLGVASGGQVQLWLWRLSDLVSAGQDILKGNRQASGGKNAKGASAR